MKIVGIDYGHGETSAGYVDSETIIGNEIRMTDLQITEEKTVIPSIICKMSTGEFVINPTDNQLATAHEIGLCFKAPLIGDEQYEEITEENRNFFRAFIQKVYESIASNENNPLHIDSSGQTDYKVYIACPSGWSDSQMQAYKTFVQEECEVPLIDIVKESRAAYIASRRKVGEGIRNQGGNVLVIDFGSSTVDFTYFNNDSKFEPVHEGYPAGASKIENDVLDFMVKSCNTEAHENYNLVIERCGKTRGRNALLFAIRKAKERFFSQDNPQNFSPSIHLRELFLDKSLTGRYIEPANEYENGYSKEVLENVILKDYKDSLADMLDDFATKEGVSSIDKVILTGGASRMYFFKQLVSEKYGVSKKEQTLIVDLEPSVTISEGIAAFGYMNEMSETKEKPLWKAVNAWISDTLPVLLRSTILKSVGDMYYDEFWSITYDYKEGRITKDGKHNLDGLEDKYLELLNNWSSDPERMSEKIVEATQNSISASAYDKIKDFAEQWNFVCPPISVKFDFDKSLSLTTESCKYLNSLIWSELKTYITERDFFPYDPNTSPFRERDYSDRSGIVSHINGILRKYFDDLNYDEDLSQELSSISSQIKEKVQDFIDEAKLQQYR